MIFKSDLKRKILVCEMRIKDLEERICPVQSHEWVKTDSVFSPVAVGDDSMRYTWQCRKCGKTIQTYDVAPFSGTVVK